MRWHDERLHSERSRNDYCIGNGTGIHRADLGRNVLDCKGVGIMLNRRDVALMIATGIMIVIATELFVWAITGSEVLYR